MASDDPFKCRCGVMVEVVTGYDGSDQPYDALVNVSDERTHRCSFVSGLPPDDVSDVPPEGRIVVRMDEAAARAALGWLRDTADLGNMEAAEVARILSAHGPSAVLHEDQGAASATLAEWCPDYLAAPLIVALQRALKEGP